MIWISSLFNSKIMNFYKRILVMFLVLIAAACSKVEHKNEPVLEDIDYNVLVDVNETQGEVSKLLMGFNTIYCFEKDKLWQNGNGKLPTMFRRFNTGILRYPGGAVVNRYHWNNLNGEGWKDNWSPTYDKANDQPASEFMNVDEYMTNVTAIGAEPMLGINMGSGLKYNRVHEGIDEAVALVQHCKDMGFDVTYFYLDNEVYHEGANYKMTAAEYAEQINLYVPAMKAVNPNIETVINWQRNITSNTGSLKTIVGNSGENIDIIEVHWYWSWENATFDHWLSNNPMSTRNQWYTSGLSYYEEIKAFKSLITSLGYGHIKLASNEWNLAPAPSVLQTPSKFESALMISEIFSQYIDANLFMANLWGVHWPNAKGESKNRLILDTENNYSENAATTVFEMFGEAMGATRIECSSSLKGVYDIAVLDESNDQIIIYLINKKQAEETLSTGVEVKNYAIGNIIATSFVKGSDANGSLTTITAKIESGNRIIIDLPKNSLTKLVVKK